MKAAAFCAGAMLYRTLAGSAPFPASDKNLAEGNFIPLRFAAPGINEEFGCLVQAALMLAAGVQKPGGTGTDILNRLLEILMPAGEEVKTAASLFRQLSGEEKALLTKEKEKFIKRKNAAVKTRRFVMRYKSVLLGSAAALVIVFLIAGSIKKSRAELPTTRGMDSEEVVQSYYNAFGELDHPLIGACLAKGADRSDLDMVINMFVISKVRQAYEFNSGLEEFSGFGVTDLSVELLSGGEDDSEIHYRAIYTLWMPAEQGFQPGRRSDDLVLARRRGNWQITEIRRSIN
jgi:hypothetical protein